MTGEAWPAPAKLNLFLHITGRRPDGYHELQTVFQFLDFGDELTFRVNTHGTIVRSKSLAGVPADQDLTVRAAHALQQRSGSRLGCEIAVEKKIPLGGGLGGGSSNAATTLFALNKLWKLNRSVGELAAIGLTLGADVPVFVRGFAAWAEGIGELLKPVTPEERWYLVVTPSVGVDTKAMYDAPDLQRATPKVTWEDFAAGLTHNDFEPVVSRRYPEVAAALAWSTQFGRPRMSGSGASVFVDFDSREAADQARAVVPPVWRSFVAKGLNRSPLHSVQMP